MGWWATGAKQADQEKKDQARRGASGRRFWLKVGESRKVVFLEDVWPSSPEEGKFWPDRTFSVYEHALRLNNDFKQVEFCTCTKGLESEFGPCEVCKRRWKDGSGKEQVFTRLYRNFTTIVDMTPWSSDDGSKVYVCSKRILVLKGEVFELLAGKGKKKREGGDPQGLKNWLVDISRISLMRKAKGQGGKDQEMAPRTGNDFEILGKVASPPQLPVKLKMPDGSDHPGLVMPDGKPLDMAPFDWPKALAPRSASEIEGLFSSNIVMDDSQARPGMTASSEAPSGGGAKATAGAASPGGEAGADEVPY